MAARFWVGGTGTWDGSDTTHWSGTSGGAGGQTVPGASDTVTLDGSSGGGTITVNTNFSITSLTMGAFTGTLDFATNNNSPTMQTFNCSGSGARVLNMGSGTWNISGSGTTVFNISTTTSLTLNANTSTINLSYSGAVGTRTFTPNNAAAGVTLNNLSITAGTDTLALNGFTLAGNLNFTGFAGTYATNGVHTISGSLTLGAGMTVSGTNNAFTFAATSGTKTITSNGVTFDRLINFDGVGGTWQFADTFVGVAARVVSLKNGVLDLNNQNVSFGTFTAAFLNTRTLTLGSGTLTLLGTGTVFDFGSATGLTFNKGTGTIKITDSTNTAITFSGLNQTYNNIWWARGASTATNTVTGTNTFTDFKDTGTAAHSIVFPNATTTVTTFTVSGSSGNLITLSRTGASGTFILSKASGAVICDYLSISNSDAKGGASWYAGANSTNGGTNTGWQFQAQDASKANFFNA